MPKFGRPFPVASPFFMPRRTISTWDACAGSIGTIVGNPVSTAWPTANLAFYWPIMIGSACLVTSFFVANGATAANQVDIGLYASDGTRISSTGATAQAGTTAIQTIDVTDFMVGPGLYYLALTADNVAVTVRALALGSAEFGRVAGLLQQTTAFALPAAATFAQFAQTIIPLYGMNITPLPALNSESVQPATIHSFHPLSCGPALGSVGTNVLMSAASAAWPTANRALFVPCWLPSPIVVTQGFFLAGTTSSGANNFDIGIYASDGATRLVSSGSTAQSGSTSVLNVANIADTEVGPGLIYMALALNSTDHVFRGNPVALFTQAIGMQQQAAAFALPASATFANPASAYVPVFGFTTMGVV